MPVAPEIYRVMDMSIDAYDTNPLPLCEILRLDPGADDEERTMQRSQKMTRSKGIAPPNKQVKWEKKDVVTKGLYKPWFFTRFARLWIPLGKPQCAMDLKSISSAASTQARRRPKKSHHTDDSSETSVLEEVWVGCDGCSKWRKVPRGFQFDKNKSFFCHMLTDTTCETPEEEWDDEEEFVDDDNVDLIVDGAHYGSISTTPRSAHSDSSQRENSTRAHSSHEHGKSPRDYSHPRDVTNNSAGMRAAGKRRLISPRVYGADDDDDVTERWKRSRRAAYHDRDDLRSRSPPHSHEPAQRVNRGGAAGGAGGQGMSRLDAVVRVLKATGKALHYDVITRQALHQGIIRFTGSQGTAGESMKAFLNKTIRENKSAAIMNMGKGVYGLKEWGRSGVAKEPPTPTASPALSSVLSPYSPAISATTSPHIQSLPISPAARKLQERGAASDSCKLPALVLGDAEDVSPDSTLTLTKKIAVGCEGEWEWKGGRSKVDEGGKSDGVIVLGGGVGGGGLAPRSHGIAELLN